MAKYTDERVKQTLKALMEVGYNCLSDDEKAVIDWLDE